MLNPNDCIHAYAPGFVNEYHDLYVVAPSYDPSKSKIDTSLYSPMHVFETAKHNNFWLWEDAEHAGFLTSQQFTAAALLAAGPWMVKGYEVSHCIAEKWTGMCSLHYHMPLMLVVLTCNVIKIGCMLWMLKKKKVEEPLVTIGDAVESYLREPDETTVPATWSTQVRHWRNAASRRTWVWYFIWYVFFHEVIQNRGC